MKRILFVNGQPEEYLQVKAALHRISDDYSVSYVASGDHLFNLLPYFTPDLLFIDTCYEHQHGTNCFHKIRAIRKFDSLPIFLYCPESQWKLIKDGDSSSINYHVNKQESPEKLRLSLQFALKRFLEKDLVTGENEAQSLSSMQLVS